MAEATKKESMKLGKILEISTKFIFKNISWILLIGFFISSLPALLCYYLEPDLEEVTSIFDFASVLFMPFLTATVVILINEQSCGRKIAWHQAFKKGAKKWMPLILLQLAIALAMMVGYVLLIIPGIIVSCAVACAPAAMLIEDLSPKEAFERSWNLTKNNRLRIFGYLLVSCVIVMIMAIPFAAVHLMSIPFLYKVGILSLISTPFMALGPAITTLVFLDLKANQKPECDQIPAHPAT